MNSYLRQRSGFASAFRRWLFRQTHRRLTIAARIMGIVLMLALPLSMVVAGAWRFSREAREVQRMGLLYMARTLGAAVDAKLGEYVRLAQSLAHSPALLNESLSAFEAEARLTAALSPEAAVLAADLEGHELVDTAGFPGERMLARNPFYAATLRRAFELQKAVIGNVREAPLSRALFIDIGVPVYKDGQPFRFLAISVDVQAFLNLLNAQQMPKNWMAGVVDDRGRCIACAPDGQAGELEADGWPALQDEHGVFKIFSLDGHEAVRATERSAVSGWVIAVAIKHPFLQEAVFNYVRWATVLTAGLSVLSILFASGTARSVTGSLKELRLKSRALVRGRQPAISPAGPPEVSELWDALQQAAAERDQSEQELQDSKEKLRLALDAAELGVWRWEARSQEMHWDARCRALFGVPAGAHITYEIWVNSITPEQRGRAEAEVARALDPADPHDETCCEYQVQPPDGTMHWLSSTGRAFFEPDPAAPSGRRALFMAGAIRDVTEVHLAGAALRESEERLRLANEAAGIGTFTIDVGSGEGSYSPELAAMLGYKGAGTAKMEAIFSRIHREDIAGVRARYEAALRGERDGQFKLDFRFVCPGGDVRWVTWAGRVEFCHGTSGRAPFRLAGAVVDITERMRAQDALRESQEQLRLSNEAAGIGVFTVDPEAGCVHYSAELAAMLGFPGVRTTKIEDAFSRVHRDDVSRARALFEAGLSGSTAARIKTDFRFVRPGGEVRWMTWAGRVHFREGPSGCIAFRIDGACVDITERMRAQEAVRESEERFRGIFNMRALASPSRIWKAGFSPVTRPMQPCWVTRRIRFTGLLAKILCIPMTVP